MKSGSCRENQRKTNPAANRSSIKISKETEQYLFPFWVLEYESGDSPWDDYQEAFSTRDEFQISIKKEALGNNKLSDQVFVIEKNHVRRVKLWCEEDHIKNDETHSDETNHIQNLRETNRTVQDSLKHEGANPTEDICVLLFTAVPRSS